MTTTGQLCQLTQVCSWTRPCQGLPQPGWRGSSWWDSTFDGGRGPSKAPAYCQGSRWQGWQRMPLSRWCPPHSSGSKWTTCPGWMQCSLIANSFIAFSTNKYYWSYSPWIYVVWLIFTEYCPVLFLPSKLFARSLLITILLFLSHFGIESQMSSL